MQLRVVIDVDDMERAVRFYVERVGLRFRARGYDELL